MGEMQPSKSSVEMNRRTELRKSFEMWESDSMICTHMGDSHRQLGREQG